MVDEIQSYFKHDIPGRQPGAAAARGLGSRVHTRTRGCCAHAHSARLSAPLSPPPPSLSPFLSPEVPYDDEDKFLAVLKKAGLTDG